jgi:hypothetical protein
VLTRATTVVLDAVGRRVGRRAGRRLLLSSLRRPRRLLGRLVLGLEPFGDDAVRLVHKSTHPVIQGAFRDNGWGRDWQRCARERYAWEHWRV